MNVPWEGWTASSHPLGRGRLDPANVRWSDGAVRLVLPAGRLDGAEIVCTERYGRGTFHARIRAADAPGSVCGLFLHEGKTVERNDGVDVTIFNDGSGLVLLNTWRGGRLTNSAEHLLGFDARAGAHDYAVDVGASGVRVSVDGAEARRWTEGVPTRPMRLMAAAWWPADLEGGPPPDDRQAVFSGLSYHPNHT